MAVVRGTLSSRVWIAIALCLCAAPLAVAGPARAGTYEVVACDAAPGGVNNSWTGSASTTMAARETCPSHQQAAAGMRVTNRVNAGTAQLFAGATMAFDAPAGATIDRLSAQYAIHREDRAWQVGFFTDSTMLSGCRPNDPHAVCRATTAWPGFSATWNLAPGARRVSIQASCQAAVGCSTKPTDSILSEAVGLHLFGATVRVRDDSPPPIWDVSDGPLTNGAWQRGAQYVGYAASDNVGIRATHLYVDGVRRGDLERPCDYTRRIPCSDLTYSRYTVETQALPDGPHELRVEAVDAAGNVGSYRVGFRSDNTAPDAPTDPVVDGGEGWRRTNSFALHWTNPGSAAPIAGAWYQLCNTATGMCNTGARGGTGINSIADLSVPGPGDYTVRVWLQDWAGNVNPANKSVPVHLRFDDVPPGRANPSDVAGWLNAVEAHGFDEAIWMGEGEATPASGIAGYSVTTDGSDPDGTIDVTGGSYRIDELPEGVTTFKARAVSGAGVASDRVGSATIRVDSTSPAVDAVGAPDPAAWQRDAVTIAIRATDQPGLSGLAPAPDAEPIENGAYVSYRIDGRELVKVRGGAADVVVPTDGEHAVTYRAADLAGNESAERTARFRIDRTAPELVVFEATDSADPRRVVVAASDRTSGIGSGVIEIRRVGSGGWRALATARSGDRFLATIDDDALLRGVYELRARVRDLAGNEAIGDRRRDGSAAHVDLAILRSDTRLAAGLVDAGSRTVTKCRRKRGRRTCVRTVTHGGPSLVPRLTLPFGRSASARGQLTTAAGDPVAGAAIEVAARPASAGSDFAPVATVRTDRLGGFSYAVPAGTSRTIRFRFPGSARERASQQEVAVRVPAAATIVASRSRVRNGQTVTFRGRLAGRPIPPDGKLLDLQAFYRGRWRTFATPRAGSDGTWRYVYRFGATRGRVLYRFRVVVRPESAYPYELGYSKEARVTVSG